MIVGDVVFPGPARVGGIPPNQVSLVYPSSLRCAGPPTLAQTLEENCPCPFWVDAEYLVLWMKSAPNSMPLLTTGTVPPGTAAFGIATAPTDSQVLYGGANLKFPAFAGFRVAVGRAWNDHSAGEIRGFATEVQDVGYLHGPNGNPTLLRPFFGNVNPAAIDNNPIPVLNSLAAIVSSPDTSTGAFAARSSQQLWGAEANWLEGAMATRGPGLTWIGGLAYRQLNGDLQLTENTAATPGNSLPFNSQLVTNGALQIVDRFQANNWFLGAQTGAMQRWLFDWGFIEVRGLVALGSTQEQVTITGSTTLQSGTLPNGTRVTIPQVLPAGIYALGSNSGMLEKSRFTVIPTGDVKLGWAVTRWLFATVGYTGMYWSSVARPGDQINRIVNVTQVPSFLQFLPNQTAPVQPKPIIRSTDFWSQGITGGLEFRF